MRYKKITDIMFDEVFLELDGVLDWPLFLKLESFNLAGSIKFKPALMMIEDLESKGILKPGMGIIESSSGNLGLALALICTVKGYSFTCVSDPKISPSLKKQIAAYGGKVVIVSEKDGNGGGFVESRKSKVRELMAKESGLVWPNQYENSMNPTSHFLWTAASIFREFPCLDYLFVGVSTAGTFVGCENLIREKGLKTKLVAVDVQGSVVFGGAARSRKITGIGSSQPSRFVDHSTSREIVYVSEEDVKGLCSKVLRANGLLAGVSTAAVLAGVAQYAPKMAKGSEVLAISPDLGTNYLESNLFQN